MNLYDYFSKNIHMDKIEEFDGNMRELALIRYVMKEASKFFYRDYTFFLNKENINVRATIYNKKIDLSDVKDFSIVCKSYCGVIKELLKKLYGIDSEEISAFNDEYRHIDLMIKTKTGNKYIIDPLTDLIEMQVGLRTNNFASKKYYENSYANILEDISFLTENELEQIDNKIGYKNDANYLDDFLKNIRRNFENLEKFLQRNEYIAIDLLGEKYDGRQLSDDEKIDLKLKYICKYLNNRKYLNGFVDLVMFSEDIIKRLFSVEEQSKIQRNSFFVDGNDLNNSDLVDIFSSYKTRKRGRFINFKEKNYIFSLGQKTLEYNNDEWQKIVKSNHIFIKPRYIVQLLKYLKDNGADRNILHNNEFLKIFNKFETALLNSGKTLEDIKNDNILIKENRILTRFRNKYITYEIQKGHLEVNDYGKNIKYIVFYEDEGRNVFYKAEKIYKNVEKEKIVKKDNTQYMNRDD